MAHFAEIDNNNIVIRVIVIDNKELLDENNNENEQKGVDFCKSLFGANTIWKQTSYNDKFRARFAGVGFSYSETLDAFIPPKPTEDDYWVLDPTIASWVPDTPRPSDNNVYVWSVKNKQWMLQNKPYNSWVMQGNPPSWQPPIPYPEDGEGYTWDEINTAWVKI